VLHGVVGVLLLAALWAIGWAAIPRRSDAGIRGRVAWAYLSGVGGIWTLATVFLLSRVAGAVLAVALAVAVVLRLRGRARQLVAAGAPLVHAGGPIALYAAASGLLFHGPGAHADSLAYGDMSLQVARMTSAAQSVAPFRDLVALGERVSPLESGPIFVGGAFSHVVPGFDFFLFQATAMPVVGLGSAAILFGALRGRRPAIVLALLAVGALWFPSWVVWSVPVALGLPLVVAGWIVLEEGAPVVEPAAIALLCVDIVLTKILLLVVFPLLWLAGPRRDRRTGGVLLGTVAVGLVLVALTSRWGFGLVSYKLGPPGHLHALAQQLRRRDTIHAAPGLYDLGLAVLLVAGWRLRERQLLVVLAGCALAYWTISEGYGFVLQLTVGAAALFVGLRATGRDDLRRSDLALLAAGSVLLALASWFNDWAGLAASLVLGAAVVAAVYVALDGSARAAWASSAGLATVVCVALGGYPLVAAPAGAAVAVALMLRPRLGRGGLVVAAALAVVALGVAARAAHAHTFHVPRANPLVLPRESYGIWTAVRKTTPGDALVFTSLTGPDVEPLAGWDYYPATGERQVYLAGWFDSQLSSDHADLRRRLALNADVLAGRRAPAALREAAPFGSYYAVVWTDSSVPRTWRLLSSNRYFALYRVPRASATTQRVAWFRCAGLGRCTALPRPVPVG
jgi:hypothetical protein